jgi:hypothetical protein
MTEAARGTGPQRTVRWYLRLVAASLLCGIILTGGVLAVPALISVRLAALALNHLSLSELALSPVLLGAACVPWLWRRDLTLNDKQRRRW